MRAVIRRQADHVLATQRTRLDGVRSIHGLRRWRDAVVASTRQQHGAGGCPLGSLVSESAEAPRSRKVLAESFARWQDELVDRFLGDPPRVVLCPTPNSRIWRARCSHRSRVVFSSPRRPAPPVRSNWRWTRRSITSLAACRQPDSPRNDPHAGRERDADGLAGTPRPTSTSAQ